VDRTELMRHLGRYVERHPEELATVDRIRRLVGEQTGCFERDSFEPGHVTASAWIVSRERGSVLLTHHRKLDRWLQLGGHTDGETDVLSAALREAREESGLCDFVVLPRAGGPEILDVDVHEIPARGSEPHHEHHDIRFLLEASEAESLSRQQSESVAMRWFPLETLDAVLGEESLARMARKAAHWLGRHPVGPG
jgi:8-oxo-dGTP pyrophosphatase MutT (NUDIX family)